MFVADLTRRRGHAAAVLSSADLLTALRKLKSDGQTTNADLGRLLGLPSSRIAEIFDGKRKVTVDEAKLIVEQFGLGGAARPAPDQPPPRSVDAGETAPVLRLDLSYSMGPGTELDDSYVDGEAFFFDLGFLRSLTITPPDRIRVVDGVGDSMQPTIFDRDLVFVDINQRDLNAQDRIWAISLFGAGAVKRLKLIGNDRVLVVSDNKDVGNQEVDRSDILIHGRVVGSIKRH